MKPRTVSDPTAPTPEAAIVTEVQGPAAIWEHQVCTCQKHFSLHRAFSDFKSLQVKLVAPSGTDSVQWEDMDLPVSSGGVGRGLPPRPLQRPGHTGPLGLAIALAAHGVPSLTCQLVSLPACLLFLSISHC